MCVCLCVRLFGVCLIRCLVGQLRVRLVGLLLCVCDDLCACLLVCSPGCVFGRLVLCLCGCLFVCLSGWLIACLFESLFG